MINQTKWTKFMLVGISMLMLTACSSKNKSNHQYAVDNANAAYGAESSGYGEESRFGDQASGAEQMLSKRVYYFDFDSNVVRFADRAPISANAEYLVAHPNMRVIVEGHTDPRGSREYNIGLGERRANAVAAILRAKGVRPTQIRVVSYGAEKLAAYGHSEADFQKDRRVVIAYVRR